MQFCFADFVLDTSLRELRQGCRPVPIEPQVFDLLLLLIENRHRVVSKNDLIASVWGGRIVSYSTLTSRINAVRKALGDSGSEQKLIRTVARKGLRFVGEVGTLPAAAPPRSDAPADGTKAPPRVEAQQLAHPVIAVLPFANMSADPDQAYFADGISEDIVAALSKLRWFSVIVRHSSFSHTHKPLSMKQIAEELGAGYVIEGSVRKAGDRVRITAQLNDVRTGNQIWAERYDRELSDVFAVQDEIAEAIVAAIEPQIFAAEHFRIRRKPPDSLDAWDLVLRALWHIWRVTGEDNRAAQVLLEKAIAIDPHCAQALGILAASHACGTNMGWEESAIGLPAAKRAAEAALQADAQEPWAHFGLACVLVYSGRLADALAAFEQALAINPNFVPALAYYAQMLCFVGRGEEGKIVGRRALRLAPHDPFSPICSVAVAGAEFFAGNYREAIRLARQAVRRRADFSNAYRVLIASAAMAGEIELAKASVEELRRVQPNVSLAWVVDHVAAKDEPDTVAFHRTRELYIEALRRAGLE